MKRVDPYQRFLSRRDDPNRVWLLSIVELPRPLEPGDSIRDREGKMALVYEVHRLKQRSSPICGKRQTLWAVLHAGSNSLTVCVCPEGKQRAWAL